MYTHVSQMAILPNSDCGIDENTYRTDRVRDDLVRVAHANNVKVTITLMQDRAINAIRQCTGPEEIVGFVSALTDYVVAHGYDGLDLDWEGEVVPRQYQDLVVRLRRAMPGKILTADIAMHQRHYLVDIQDHLDRINIMSYDLWRTDYDGKRLTETWHHAALLSGGDRQNHQSAEAGVSYVLESKIKPGKINLGVPFYGYALRGCRHGFESQPNCRKPISAPMEPFSEKGIEKTQVEFNRIMATYGSGDVKWDETHKTPYIIFRGALNRDCGRGECVDDAFVTFTDQRQMKESVDFVIAKELGGIMTFALHQEFMADEIGFERYPLSSSIYMAFALRSKL